MNEGRDFGRGKVVLFIDRRREVEMCGWLASSFPRSYKGHVGRGEIRS
jgi:hypothetical protein